MLRKNFDRAYNGTTRAPFGLYMHAAWFFGNEWRYTGYKQFIEYLVSLNDVWIVPISAGFEYFKNPMTNDELINNEFQPFNCEAGDYPTPNCEFKENCK